MVARSEFLWIFVEVDGELDNPFSGDKISSELRQVTPLDSRIIYLKLLAG